MHCIMSFLLLLLLTLEITFTDMIIVTNVVICIIVMVIINMIHSVVIKTTKTTWRAYHPPQPRVHVPDNWRKSYQPYQPYQKYKKFGLEGHFCHVNGMINKDIPNKGWCSLPPLQKHYKTWELNTNSWGSDEQQLKWKTKRSPSVKCTIEIPNCNKIRTKLNKPEMLLNETGEAASNLAIYFENTSKTDSNSLFQYVGHNNDCKKSKKLNLIIKVDWLYCKEYFKQLYPIYRIQHKLQVLYYVSMLPDSNIKIPLEILHILYNKMNQIQ